MGNINRIVGANLKKLRESFGYTQEDFAIKIGVSRPAYGNYESGLREMPYEFIEKASTVFGCDSYILFDENLSSQEDVLICAFRMDDISEADFEEICRFKDVVRNYLKMNRIA